MLCLTEWNRNALVVAQGTTAKRSVLSPLFFKHVHLLQKSPPNFQYSQSLDGAQGGEQALADCLQFVIVQRQQVEVLQVLEGVDSQAVDFVGVQQPENTQGDF